MIPSVYLVFYVASVTLHLQKAPEIAWSFKGSVGSSFIYSLHEDPLHIAFAVKKDDLIFLLLNYQLVIRLCHSGCQAVTPYYQLNSHLLATSLLYTPLNCNVMDLVKR